MTDAGVEQVLVEPGDHVQAKALVLVSRPL